MNTPPRLAHRISYSLSVTALWLWAVATWLTGYVFAPLMFAHFDKGMAGQVIGHLLGAVYIISLLSAAVMLLDYRLRHAKRLAHVKDLWLIVCATLLVVVQYTAISPKMAALKQLISQQPDAAIAFARWHGVSQTLYLITSLILLRLVWLRLKNQTPPL